MDSFKKVLFLVLIAVTCNKKSFAQNQQDTLISNRLDSIIVSTYISNAKLKFLPDVVGTNVYAGKKTNIVYLDPNRINLAQNMTRTAFAKIPGLTMWDMDGSGLQINVGSRGTDSHRSIEMNMRQNGYNINSDMFGYPEDHYTPPFQAIQQLQLVRGSAALQFGSQFGGMMNYVMKEGDSTKPLVIESQQTSGSNNFFNSYNAIGGTKGKLSYYTYYDYRHGDGWRPNAGFNYHAYYFNLNYHFNSRTSLALQFSRMDYAQQIAGGLTDAQFRNDARQSLRSRNWFNPEINIPALTFKYDLSSNTRFEVISNALFGQRNSVQFIASPVVADTFNTVIGSYNPRQVDRDYYRGFTTEARLLHKYKISSIKSVLSGGLRYSNETTKRKQKGIGTTGSNFDLSLVKPYGIDLRFSTRNYAIFAENIFQLTDRFSIIPGIRYEVINTNLEGRFVNGTVDVAYKGNRSFPLLGTGLQYQVNKNSQLYGNMSQAYRPFLYANVTPADRVDVIDPNLKDSKGYDIDFGYRGNYRDVLNFDINAFYLFYGDRVGLLSAKKPDNSTYLLTTNIGDAVTKGAELYVELSLLKSLIKRRTLNDIRIFNSLSYNHARYKNGEINKSGTNISLSGKRVENVPDWMNKTGLTLQHNQFTTTIQYSYTSKSFNDAFNTTSSADGITGVIPAYSLWDWSLAYRLTKELHLSAGVNNFTNNIYFNRRITMYPGPGILPADGRTFYFSVGIKL
ncbi:MAG: TonB-dependent receptor [Segetibacter sp.]|nr:TonB-dependent receptor [Segetibacter sp.]